MASDPLIQQVVDDATALHEAGRRQGLQEAQAQFMGTAAVRLTAGLFATAMFEAASLMGSYSPVAAQFFAAKAQELADFATPPQVANVSPANGATTVSSGDQVVLSFASPMDEASLTDATVYVAPSSGGAHLSADLSYDAASRTLTLVPRNGFSAGTAYTITVTKDVLSKGGQAMGQDYSSSFVTQV